MKFNASTARLTAALIIPAAAVVLIGADLVNPPAGNLTVHEWGTFTSIAGEDGAPVTWDALGGKDDLPAFVNNGGYRCTKVSFPGTVRMETPVVYFYSQRETTARVNVGFPHGIISEWYPKGDIEIYQSKAFIDSMSAFVKYPADAVYQTKDLIDPPPASLAPQLVKLSANRNGIDTSLRNLMSSISWSGIKIQPGATPQFPTATGKSRYYAARTTDAAPLTVNDQHEKFLFYRGVGRFPIPLTARLLPDAKVHIENTGSDAVPSVIIFENRGSHLGYRSLGAVATAMTLDRPALNGQLPQLTAELEQLLIAQGLYPKEAHAMVETWRDSWFEEGTRLIYILPSRAVDTSLPLHVEPSPAEIARVFVGRIELITPEILHSVQEALAKNDYSAGDRYGRFLSSILKRVKSENPASAAKIENFLQESRKLGADVCR